MFDANIIIICENFKKLKVFADYSGGETSIVEDLEAIVNAAEEKVSFTVPQVHSASPTVCKLPATLARFCLAHPCTVAKHFELCVPDFHEVILIDVALAVVCPDTGAGRDGTIRQN